MQRELVKQLGRTGQPLTRRDTAQLYPHVLQTTIVIIDGKEYKALIDGGASHSVVNSEHNELFKVLQKLKFVIIRETLDFLSITKHQSFKNTYL